ncbi:MAG: phosphotransferase [Candidatus Thorarchaeota archaeon]
MTNRPLVAVHGHAIAELAVLLQDACYLFDKTVSLEDKALGGWSNINIRGQSDGIDFVLKLPCSVSSNDIKPYKKLYDVSLFLNHRGIAPLPLYLGRLNDAKATPFIIFEFVDGVIHDTLTEFTTPEIVSLKKCLLNLSSQKPPGLREYESSSDYLIAIHSIIENHEGLSICSQELDMLIESFDDLYSKVLSYTDTLGKWHSSTMHGDLWVPNIIFQDEKVILLDFEACAYGNRLYDYAYLLEAPVNSFEYYPQRLLHEDEVVDVNQLRPLALAYLIAWSLERLLSAESGLIEPSLATPASWSAVANYTRSKISRLKNLLS